MNKIPGGQNYFAFELIYKKIEHVLTDDITIKLYKKLFNIINTYPIHNHEIARITLLAVHPAVREKFLNPQSMLDNTLEQQEHNSDSDQDECDDGQEWDDSQ